jgi:CRISPR-associated protein (TIGR03986 family)
MALSPEKVATEARKVAKVLQQRGGGLSARERRDLALDYIAEDLGIDDPADQNAIYVAAQHAPQTPSAQPAAKERREQSRGKRRPRPELNKGELKAPFRFIALNEKVVLADHEVVERGLDLPVPGGFCGVMTVEWAAETPILIGARGDDDVDGPLRLGSDGPYVIPGATLRGLVRAACETVSYGRLFQINRHHRYGVRDFTHPLFSDENRTTWDELRSGWLRKKEATSEQRSKGLSDYVLAPCDKRLIRIRSLPEMCNSGGATNNGQFHREWLNTELAERYRKVGQTHSGQKAKALDFESLERASRFTQEGEDYVRPDPNGSFRGYFVFANKSPTLRDIDAAKLDFQESNPRQGDQKKREYVFAAETNGEEVRLRQDQFDRFELAHTKPSKNKRAPDGSYAVLQPTLDAHWRIPVFYIGDPKSDQPTFSMGLTRLFKRSHNYSVGDMLAREGAHAIGGDDFHPDVVESLFGYLYEKDELGKRPADSTAPEEIARKGRVAFGFAKIVDGAQARLSRDAIRTVMMGPRASYAPFYLRGSIKDWSDSKSRLAGRKHYFPRFPDAMATAQGRENAAPAIVRTLTNWQGNGGGEIQTHVRFLESAAAAPELVFRGDIRVHNVTAAEIGALLWAITHGGDPAKPFRHMIGRAKTAGAGQVRVKSIALAFVGNDSDADALLRAPAAWELPGDGREGWSTPSHHGMSPFLLAFEKLMQRHDARWPKTPTVLEFLGASRPQSGAEIAKKGLDGYFELQDFQRIRQTAKLDTRWENPGSDTPDRYLPAEALPAAQLIRPYAA